MNSLRGPLRRICLIAALGLVASPVTVPASARSPELTREQAESRARELAEQLVGRLRSEADTSAFQRRSLTTAIDSDGCFEDEEDDTFKTEFGEFLNDEENFDLTAFYAAPETGTPLAHPPADITKVCADYQATELELKMQIKDPVPPADHPGVSYRIWLIDTLSLGEADTFVFHVSFLGFELAFLIGGTEQDPVSCSAIPMFDDNWFVASRIPAGCLGDAEQIDIAAMTIDVPEFPEDPDAEIGDIQSFFDLAPGGGVYEGPLARPARDGPRPKNRLADDSRIGTAIKISQHQFPEDGSASEVYLARADDFPDALAGGVLVLGPILLVPNCGDVPEAVAAEIDRLDPDSVVALGGPAAICDELVFDAAGDDREAARASGPTRIETAIAIALGTFEFGADVVYLARSDNFPDALAGGILLGGPILLVPSCGDLPQVVADAIGELGPDTVIALGGSAAICDSMLQQAAAGRAFDRYSGDTRFHTAVAISQAAFPFGAVEVYLARADNFPDALAGGILTLGPILLVSSCGDLSEVVADEIARLNPTTIVPLGGTAAICEDVVDQAAAS